MIDLAALWLSVLSNEGEDLLRRVDEAARGRPAWRAEVRIERCGKRSETRTEAKGTLTVRPGEPAALEVRGRREVPDLWQGNLAVRFRAVLRQRSSDDGIVAGPDGATRPPAKLRLRKSGALVAAGAPRDLHELTLVPRDAGQGILEVRLFVEPGTLRPVRAEVETAAQVETWTLGRIEEPVEVKETER